MTRRLRQQVLRPQLSVTDELPGDEVADIAIHFAAWLDDAAGPSGQSSSPVSACVVYPDACPFRQAHAAWHLRQMATDPRHQGIGAGRAVLAAVVAHLEAAHADLLWCNARVSAQGFYEQAGFETFGEVFTDERHPVPHIRMWRPIP